MPNLVQQILLLIVITFTQQITTTNAHKTHPLTSADVFLNLRKQQLKQNHNHENEQSNVLRHGNNENSEMSTTSKFMTDPGR